MGRLGGHARNPCNTLGGVGKLLHRIVADLLGFVGALVGHISVS